VAFFIVRTGVFMKLTHSRAVVLRVLALLEVIFGILLAWFGANELPGSSVLTGGALVIGALAVNELIGWRQRA